VVIVANNCGELGLTVGDILVNRRKRMGIKRFVDKKEVEQMMLRGNPYDGLLNDIVKGLQTNEGKYVEIELKDVVPLRNRLKYMKKMGCLSYDYQHLKIFKLKTGDNQVSAFVRWTEQVVEPKVTKKITPDTNTDTQK
jgi:hypothetical protein